MQTKPEVFEIIIWFKKKTVQLFCETKQPKSCQLGYEIPKATKKQQQKSQEKGGSEFTLLFLI